MRMAFSVLFLVISLAGSAFAQGPAEVLKVIVGKLKSSGDIRMLEDYVDWNTMLSDFGAEEREEFGIKTAEDLRNFYRKSFEDPSFLMKEMLDKQREGATAEEKAKIDETMKEMEKSIQEDMVTMKKQLTETEYTVGKETIEGDRAKVELTTKFEGDTKSDQVEFVKVNNKWLLATLEGIESEDYSEAEGAFEEEEVLETPMTPIQPE